MPSLRPARRPQCVFQVHEVYNRPQDKINAQVPPQRAQRIVRGPVGKEADLLMYLEKRAGLQDEKKRRGGAEDDGRGPP